MNEKTTASSAFFHANPGLCPVCSRRVEFRADHPWFRDHLLCSSCGSVPRERALALVLQRRFPDWRSMRIHESSPSNRGISARLRHECPGYVATQYFPGKPAGQRIRRLRPLHAALHGFRNEDLQALTFADESFDLTITLDVLEHVNKPDRVMCEVRRTLRPGGAFLFTVPTLKDRVESARRARYRPDGTIEHLAPPQYHGNPVSKAGALVTFDYGYDLPELIHSWSGMDVEVIRFHDRFHGILGDFTEVYIATRGE